MKDETRKNLVIDEAIVWQAVTKHLPILVEEVKELLGK